MILYFGKETTAGSISKYRFMIREPSGHELCYSRYDRSCPDVNHSLFMSWFLLFRTVKSIGSYHNSIGSYCEIFRFVSQSYRAVLWNLSVRITILSGRAVISISSYHNSIGPYCEIYRFVSQFYRAVLWNLSIHITILSGIAVKYICSYRNSIGPYCEIYRFVSQFDRAVLWNLSVRITILSGRTVKSICSYHNSICSYSLFVVFWTVAIGNLHFDCPRNPTTCKDADHHLGKAGTGSYHRPTNHRVTSWNRPRTVSCIVHDEFYQFVS
jgi:hypothetical protein